MTNAERRNGARIVFQCLLGLANEKPQVFILEDVPESWYHHGRTRPLRPAAGVEFIRAAKPRVVVSRKAHARQLKGGSLKKTTNGRLKERRNVSADARAQTMMKRYSHSIGISGPTAIMHRRSLGHEYALLDLKLTRMRKAGSSTRG